MVEFDINSELSTQKGVLEQMENMDHEQVVFCRDKKTGLKAIIAVHNTVLGPSLGGCRMWNYTSEAEALKDVLRLSRGMTYKSAVAGLDLGGGKAVIIGDPKKDKTDDLMRAFGRFVDSLGGKYITAEDVGMQTRDMSTILETTKYVTGIAEELGGGGNPSPVTGLGVYKGIKASAKFKWGDDSLKGRTVAVQGIGNVGETVVKHLTEEGAIVYINDISPERMKQVCEQYGATIVSNEELYSLNVDIYAPCALGATLNDITIPQLNCSIVAGAANNQLADENRHGKMLMERGIIYAPDFVINAGGIINVYDELIGYNRERAMERTENIYNSVLRVLEISMEKNIPSGQAAIELAEMRIKEAELKN